MARRKLVDIDNKIIAAIHEIGSHEGIARVTSQKVAERCDISHFTCFDHFGTKREMLAKAARVFAERHMSQLLELSESKRPLEEIWDEILDSFIADSNGAIYYFNYVRHFGLDPEKSEERRAAVLRCAHAYLPGAPEWTEEDYLMRWDYATMLLFYYTEKIVNGPFENTPESRARIRQVVLYGLLNN